jgi:hypothetical protein
MDISFAGGLGTPQVHPHCCAAALVTPLALYCCLDVTALLDIGNFLSLFWVGVCSATHALLPSPPPLDSHSTAIPSVSLSGVSRSHTITIL